MKRLALSSFLFTLLVIALFWTPICRADIISITPSTLNQCGQGGIVCNGTQAFSLTALENGSIQLGISNSQTPAFVIVNDTGSTVTNLSFSYYGSLATNANLNCQINGGAQAWFNSCTVTGNGASGSGTTTLNGPIMPPAQFNFLAGTDTGIINGADFNITTASFAHAGQDSGYISGINVAQTPEPSSLALLSTGLAGIAALLRRRKVCA